MNIAVRTGKSAIAKLNSSKITGSSFALPNEDGNSYIEASKCKIVGPVSPGVAINN